MRKLPRSIRRFLPSWHRAVLFFGVLALFGVLAIGTVVAATVASLPKPDELFSRDIIQSTKIYDRTGSVLLYEIAGEVRRTVIPYDEMPSSVRNAAVAVEDANFYSHGGIDLRGIARAVFVNLASQDIRQGGSTITQQLAKKAFLTDDRTWTRKIREIVLAVMLEYKLSKDEILHLYLNQIPYGQNAYGIEAAAETYFGKDAKNLTTAESALLASLPRAPSYYSPYGSHVNDLMARKDFVITRMQNLGYLTKEEAAEAKAEQLKFLPAARNIRAPHFALWVRELLIEKYGEDEVAEGGLTVTTSLDWRIQEEAEKIVKTNAERNNTLVKGANMSLVSLDPKTGDILAMVGSRDYFADPEPAGCTPGVNCRLDPQVNASLRLRQPGSAFKPFVYAAAFQKGFRPETVLFDVPTEFTVACASDGSGPMPPCYHPGNYDETFRGPVTLRQSIAQSLNVPSVKLLYLTGTNEAISTAQSLGIKTLTEPKRYGLSLVLGGAEVKLLEIVSAYGGFANDGVWNAPVAILKVTDARGHILEEAERNPKPAIEPDVARAINDVLSDNEARIPVFSPTSSLYFPGKRVAAKTGTTQDYRDAWAIGYTPSIAVGVWAGNSNNAPIEQKGSGVLAAAPTFHDVMAKAMEFYPYEDFIPHELPAPEKPVLRGVWQGDTVITIDTVSGKRATAETPPETRKDIAIGTPHDPLYWIDPDDPQGSSPNGRDPQYRNWEASFQRWLIGSGFTPTPPSSLPQDFDDIHTEAAKPKITASITRTDETTWRVSIGVTGKLPINELTLRSGGREISRDIAPSFPWHDTIGSALIADNVITISARDAGGNRTTVDLPVK